MGFNSTVVVMNDALDSIANDKEFGKKLSDAILGLGVPGGYADVSAMSHVNAATVIETHHADFMVVVGVGGNMGVQLGPGGGYRATNEDMLRTLADSMGFDLRRKPKRVKRAK